MVKDTLRIEDAEIIFKNFSGKPSQYNREGDRNFCVVISEEDAPALMDDGWNVKIKDREDGSKSCYLPVKVVFKNFPPKIWLVTGKNKVLLDEDTVEELDFAIIQTADLAIRPYNWEVNGKSGIAGYLKTAYFVVEEDEFAAKYEFENDPQDPDVPF